MSGAAEGRVVVAMSGGVDSSVAAAMLVEEGATAATTKYASLPSPDAELASAYERATGRYGAMPVRSGAVLF